MQQIGAYSDLIIRVGRFDEHLTTCMQHVLAIQFEAVASYDAVAVQFMVAERLGAQLETAPMPVIDHGACDREPTDAPRRQRRALVLRSVGPIELLLPVESGQAPHDLRARQLHWLGVNLGGGVCIRVSSLDRPGVRQGR